MSLDYFESNQRIDELRASPGGRLLEGFAHNLWLVGYAQITGRRHV